MWYVQQLIGLASIAVVTACSSASGLVSGTRPKLPDVTQSEILSKPDVLALQSALITPFLRRKDGEAVELPYTLLAGFQQDVGVRAAASIDEVIPVALITGTARVPMTGTFDLLAVTNIDVVDDFLDGVTTLHSDTINLTADFGAGRLIGQNETTGDLLTINGQFVDRKLGGAVTYGGVTGALDGVIGSDRAVAVFHGNNDALVYVGGFDIAPK